MSNRVEAPPNTVLAATLGKRDPIQLLMLAGFLLSTPVVCYFVFFQGQGKDEPEENRAFWVGIQNDAPECDNVCAVVQRRNMCV